MMTTITRRSVMQAALVPLASSGGWTALGNPARADTWPTKPVRVIVASPAWTAIGSPVVGSSTDAAQSSAAASFAVPLTS